MSSAEDGNTPRLIPVSLLSTPQADTVPLRLSMIYQFAMFVKVASPRRLRGVPVARRAKMLHIQTLLLEHVAHPSCD